MIGVLVSGEGTNLQALLDAGLLGGGGRIEHAWSACARASRRAGVPSAVFPLEDHSDRAARDAAMADWLGARQVGLVVAPATCTC